jgi:osmotically-inducible protein OsmY
MKKIALGAALGAALPYAVRRRKQLQQKLVSVFKRGTRSAAHARRKATASAYGVSQRVQHRHEEPKDYDDATLAHKVETEIFRDADAPKGRVDVNVQNGVVQLRGEVDRPELIDDLVARTRKVQGVRDVENLLHTPGTPAPMHQ